MTRSFFPSSSTSRVRASSPCLRAGDHAASRLPVAVLGHAVLPLDCGLPYPRPPSGQRARTRAGAVRSPADESEPRHQPSSARRTSGAIVARTTKCRRPRRGTPARRRPRRRGSPSLSAEPATGARSRSWRRSWRTRSGRRGSGAGPRICSSWSWRRTAWPGRPARQRRCRPGGGAQELRLDRLEMPLARLRGRRTRRRRPVRSPPDSNRRSGRGGSSRPRSRLRDAKRHRSRWCFAPGLAALRGGDDEAAQAAGDRSAPPRRRRRTRPARRRAGARRSG